MLSGSCETWFNQLALPIRTNYEALEQAFCERYINAAHTQIRRQMETLVKSKTKWRVGRCFILPKRAPRWQNAANMIKY